MIALLTLLAPLQAADSVLTEHVLSVLTSNEYGSRRRYTVRWPDSPSLAVVGGSDAHRQLAFALAAELSAAIAPLAINIVDDPSDAQIRLYFDDHAALTAIARREGFEFIPGNAGLFWGWWDARGRLSRMVILIQDRWAADDPFMQHLLLEEMTQSLGLMNDSPRFPESVVYETPLSSGSATTLGELDMRTLTLLYSLKPGSRKCRVKRNIRRKWDSL